MLALMKSSRTVHKLDFLGVMNVSLCAKPSHVASVAPSSKSSHRNHVRGRHATFRVASSNQSHSADAFPSVADIHCRNWQRVTLKMSLKRG